VDNDSPPKSHIGQVGIALAILGALIVVGMLALLAVWAIGVSNV
jgi:hypothetical protein